MLKWMGKILPAPGRRMEYDVSNAYYTSDQRHLVLWLAAFALCVYSHRIYSEIKKKKKK